MWNAISGRKTVFPFLLVKYAATFIGKCNKSILGKLRANEVFFPFILSFSSSNVTLQ